MKATLKMFIYSKKEERNVHEIYDLKTNFTATFFAMLANFEDEIINNSITM
jgi:hypothetical protein